MKKKKRQSELAFWSELDGIFALKVEQRTPLRDKINIFTFPAGFDKNLVEHCGASQLTITVKHV